MELNLIRYSNDYRLYRADDNSLVLKQQNPTTLRWKKVETKKQNSDGIVRKQFDINTGKQIGESVVKRSTNHSSGSIIVNDKSIKMSHPIFINKGKISQNQLLRKDFFRELDASTMTPMAKRVVGLVLNALRQNKML